MRVGERERAKETTKERREAEKPGVFYTATWEGEKLVVTPGEGNPPTAFRLTRYMVDSLMVTELDYPPGSAKAGISMKRTFIKKE